MSDYSQADMRAAVIALTRLQPYLAQGMTMSEAGAALLRRDAELFEFMRGDSEAAQTLREELATEVYNELRGE